MKKLLAMLLLLAMLGTMLVACNKDKGNAGDGKQTGEVDDAADESLPEAKEEYVDREYNIIYRDTYEHEWVFDADLAGSHINDAIFKRNQAVETRYKVLLMYHPVVSSGYGVYETNFMGPVETAILANENAYQLVAGYEYRLAYTSALGNFVDWYTVSNVNLDGEWWDGGFASAASYHDHTYIMNGSLSLSHLYTSSCMFFNQDIINSKIENGTEEIFGKVQSGDWTLEAFETYVKMFTADDDGVEGMSENDSYGLGTNDTTAVDAFLFCSNISVSGRTDDGEIKIYSVGDKLSNLATTLHRIINTSGNTFNQSTANIEGLDIHIGMISKGKTAFSTGVLENATKLRETNVNYGILPYPKYDEKQKNYYSITMDFSTAFAIPKTEADDLDFVGAITEAMAYYSDTYVKDALYNTVLKYRDAKDEESSKCVDIILGNTRYDFAYIYAYSWGDQMGPSALLRSCIRAKTDAITILFDSYSPTYTSKLTTLLENFQ